MINTVRELVHDLLQKNNRGWLSPERFNNFAYLSQQEVFESYFHDYNRWVTAQISRQAHDEYANIPDNIRQKIDRFLVTDVTPTSSSTNVFQMESDFYRLFKVYYDDGVNDITEVEMVSNRKLKLLQKSNLTAPEEAYPVYVRKESGSGDFPQIVVYPSSITTGISVDYIRIPATPKWTYTVVSNNPVYNPSASDFQDFEIHPSDMYRLVHKILSYSGLTIREADVVQYAEAQEQQQKQNESRQ